ncbi:MAG TPA: hypothetical protein VE871_09315 [Longimicrobium sp.]|nr:hypothetical protein [Longimicrobium sp.]
MRHGDELEVVGEGIRIYQKSVEPLGIVDKSRCWGRWVRGQRSNASEERFPHLVISPINPAFWASVFHLEMKLLDEAGALQAATGVLSDLGVNILFSDGAHSGYRQATYSAICEVPRIRQQISKILSASEFPPSQLFPDSQSVLSSSGEDLRERQFQEIGALLLLVLAGLQARIRIRENEMFERFLRKEAGAPSPFLHSRAVETGPQPWYIPEAAVAEISRSISLGETVPIFSPPDTLPPELASTFKELRGVLFTRHHTQMGDGQLLTQEAVEARAHHSLAEFTRYYLHTLWRSHWVEPVSMRALLTLAYQRVWSGDKAIEFRYEASENLLRFDGESSKRAFFDVVGRGQRSSAFPHLGIASFHKHDRFIRLRVLEQNLADRLVTTTVTYKTLHTDRTVPQPITKGLLHSISSALSASRINLLRVSSQAAEFDPQIEHGTIRMIGILPELPEDPVDRKAAFDRTLESANTVLASSLREFESTVPHPGCEAEVSVRPFARRKLFLSMPEDANRREEIIQQVQLVAADEGFSVIQARTDTGDVTQNVVALVRSSDAMLQVFVGPDGPYKDSSGNRTSNGSGRSTDSP